MPFAPIFALSAPTIALVLLVVLGAIPRTRPVARFLLPAAAVLSLLGVLAARMEPAEEVLLSRWSPEILLEISPILRADPTVWPMAVAAAASVVAAGLVQLSRRSRSPFALEVAILGILAVVLGGLWSDNPLATLLAWGGFDLMWVLGVVAAGGPSRRLAWGAGANLLATALLWTATLAIGAKGSLASWELASLDGPGRSLLLFASLLRLGLYPLHLVVLTEGAWALPAAAPLLLGPVLGWRMLIRAVSIEGGASLTGTPWLVPAGVTALLVGAFIAWAHPRPQEGVPWLGMAANGLILWGGLAAGEQSGGVIALGATAWALGVTLVLLGRGWRRGAWWWILPPAMGGWALLGGPLTPAAAALSDAVASAVSGVGNGLLFFVGVGLLTAALARRVFRPAAEEVEEPLAVAARAAGLGLPATLVLVAGVLPPSLLVGDSLPPWWRGLDGRALAGWELWLA
ncbi:MAG TPA: hypothetical protein ENK08_07625, partial [Chloroflexi bacterium]|nr:hypothetical protein [Chloroflexota bacterium]